MVTHAGNGDAISEESAQASSSYRSPFGSPSVPGLRDEPFRRYRPVPRLATLAV